MNEAFATLSRTDGVIGVVVFDDGGRCIANDLPPPYEPILLAEVLRRLSAAFDVFSSLDSAEVTSFAVDCEEGSVVVRRVEQHWVLALTQAEVNMSLLNVAMNVVVLNLSRSSGSQPIGRNHMDTPSARSAQMTHSTHAEQLEIPPDALDRSAVQQLLIIYTEYLGPAAKPIMKQQLAALGVTSRTLRRGQLSDLVARLSAKIPVAARQQEFSSAVQAFRQRVSI
jgi:predicted regulator of Ras-like GTPase activity (Roadblock/LC7/MglB family)